MQRNSESIICPQITVCVIAALKIFFAIGGTSYISSWFIGSPLFAVIIAIFVILGISNKNYGFYNCAQVTCIILSVLESILIGIIIIACISSDTFIKEM